MQMGGQPPRVMAIMWALTAVSWVMVFLRNYTRIWIVRYVGADDHVYTLTGFMLLLYTVFLQISSEYGFGQPVASLQLDDAVRAVECEMIGQTFAVYGMATAKVSLGLFLLRIVVERWHKMALWFVTVLTLAVSMVVSVLFWTQCVPIRSLYDPRVSGKCTFGIAPFSVLLGVTCLVADFFFALFPWVFIFKLNMKFKEKMTIAASLSLGIIAGVAGIIRTISLGGIASRNYTEDTVPLILWSNVEIVVTMICAGIPVLWPLYRRVRDQVKTGRGTKDSAGTHNRSGYVRGTGAMSADINLDKINTSGTESDIEAAKANNRGFPLAHPKLGIRGPTTKIFIGKGENRSDEGILGSEYRRSVIAEEEEVKAGQIQVKDRIDVRVEHVGKGMV